ncbi:MAG: M48 family metallopeptidase [Candidatus Saccharimonadales bacterium]
MAAKVLDVPGVGAVKIYKRKGNRNLNLRLDKNGEIRVTMPPWLPYAAGASFAASKISWIASQKSGLSAALKNGQPIGKAHHLYFESSRQTESIKTRLKDSSATVIYPSSLDLQNLSVQQAAKKLANRALKKQAEQLLPGRLAELAASGGFRYKSLSCRNLSARWGSCDSKTNITLSIYLLLLPWELIDYVIWHELSHTLVMRHGPDFWQELGRHVNDTKALRREIRLRRPSL